MAYTKTTTLISRPIESSYSGIEAALGDVASTLKSGASSVLDFFGAGLKAQGGQEALAAQMKADAEARAAAASRASGGGIPTTYLVVGGLALAGVLAFAMRRK
jgi:hypothetical protein